MRVLHALLLLALPAVLSAQGSGDGKGNRQSYRDKIRAKTAKMRQAMREGKIRRYNVYVTVRLKNGERMSGVVKEGRFVELDDGMDFVTSVNKSDPRAGLRVWYTGGTNSYIFLPYKDLAQYKIGRRLSTEQVKAIEGEIAKTQRERRENFRRLQEKRRLVKKQADARKNQGPLGAGGPPSDSTAGVEPLTDEEKALLSEFPSDQGWGQDKLNRLKLNRITIRRFPNEQEAKFEKIFASWKKAFDRQELIAKAARDARAAKDARAARDARDSRAARNVKGAGQSNRGTTDPSAQPGPTR